ncbi:MAG TPA: hydroxyphenylacetyl-CoA thioesterase PaaI [Gammaproteobacteria bacterium]|jgi:acyl-CoA thioesterase
MIKHTATEALALARDCAERMYAADRASRALAIRIEIPAPGSAEARMPVTSRMVNGHDICHGGYIFTLADTAFAFACNAYGKVTVAAGATIEFLAPAKLGDRLLAVANEISRGGRNGLYDVTVTDQRDRVIAMFRGRSVMLNEPLPGKTAASPVRAARGRVAKRHRVR